MISFPEITGLIKAKLQVEFLAPFCMDTTWGAYSMVVEPASIRACVRPFTFSKIFFSETAWPIKAKFYVEHSCVGGTKVCFLSRSDKNWLLWQLEVSIDLYGEKVEIGIFRCQAKFCFYINVYRIVLHV